jgi:hypothetical protein
MYDACLPCLLHHRSGSPSPSVSSTSSEKTIPQPISADYINRMKLEPRLDCLLGVGGYTLGYRGNKYIIQNAGRWLSEVCGAKWLSSLYG